MRYTHDPKKRAANLKKHGYESGMHHK